MANLRALARAHMVQEVRDAAAVQVGLGAVFDRTIDPSNIMGTFPDFMRFAVPLITTARAKQVATASRYYAAAKAAADLADPAPTVIIPALDLSATASALRVNGPVAALAQIGRGVPAVIALQSAKARTMNAGKRLTLDGSRRTLLSLARADKDVRSWARVSDGSPCAFCAMLVSRGPVYSEGTAYFETHNGCGCSAEPVFRTDRSGGWSQQSRQLADLWKESGGELSSFRSAYSETRDDPESDVTKSLTAPAKAA